MADTHTFLLEPGLWLVEGWLDDGGDGPYRKMTGFAQVQHQPDVWTYVLSLKVAGSEEDSVSCHTVVPMEKERVATVWAAQSPTLGAVTGRFIVVGDSIISELSTKDGHRRGMEVYTVNEDGSYLARGALWRDEEIETRWAMRLLPRAAAAA